MLVAEVVTPAGTAHNVRRNRPRVARVAAYGVPAESTAVADNNGAAKKC
ncbi:hypothetical protein T479_15560 [Lysinibacillus varians]|nr:hypothetical protein T479_15560 [Lysinibacillus varians]